MRKSLASLGAVLVAALSGAAVAAPPAQAAPAPVARAATAKPTLVKGPGLALKAGKHHSVSRTMWAGSYVLNGREGWCVSYNLLAPNGRVGTGTAAAVMPKAAVARAAYIVNAPRAGDRAHANARVWFALATLIAQDPAGQPTRAGQQQALALRADLPGYIAQLTPGDRAGYRALLAASVTAGKLAMKVAAPQLLPKQRGTVTVTVTTGGRPAAGALVTLTGTKAKVAKSQARTDRRGRARFAVTPEGFGATVRATAVVPSSSTVWLNRPSAGHQVILGGGHVDRATGATTIICPVIVRLIKTCECEGPKRVTYRVAITPGAPYVYWVHLRVGDRTETAPNMVAGQPYVSLSLPVVAGDKVSVYTTAHTAETSVEGPPAPTVAAAVLDRWVQQ